MDDDEDVKNPVSHEVGMRLDALSVEELEARIALLNEEIARLSAAIDAKRKTRSEADAVFRL
jgi:uncharacterized small protein (DUF1192 family)